MKFQEGMRQTGVPAALGAALLFGAGTPLAKLLLASVSPWLLASLLYLGSGTTASIHLSNALTAKVIAIERFQK